MVLPYLNLQISILLILFAWLRLTGIHTKQKNMVGKEDVYKCINRLNKCLAYLAIVLEWTAIFSIFHLYNRNNDNHFSLLTSYTLVPISKCSTQKYLMTLKPIPPKLRESADVTWEDGSGKCDSGIFSSILTAQLIR